VKHARSLGLPLLLFVATVATTTWSGGAEFSATLLSILVAHEMGHYVAARWHGVPASLPHFIPLPPPFMLGTLGAVITMRTDRARRHQLLDIGAAGPIAGFIVAVPAMVIGIRASEVGSLEGAGAVFHFGDSLLSAALIELVGPPLADGQELMAHPILIGAWAGFLVTAINLLPMGQLDGGHVLYAWTPDRAEVWARRVFRSALALGAVGFVVHAPALAWMILEGFDATHLVPMAAIEATRPLYPWTTYAFAVWALLGRATGLRHPPVTDPEIPLSRGRRLVAITCLAIFGLTFMPNPLWLDRFWIVAH